MFHAQLMSRGIKRHKRGRGMSMRPLRTVTMAGMGLKNAALGLT